ncbi:hypothetical protein [Novosphingobium ginsenosidimutans]|uniref:Uncharacterized protein n=2 Tax=Novosphingobium ginsenosidimutans TaxID=1176536 RepID=A0A5B8S5K2_9SPHN|nr:hypothetical protein [Novosphingobium ginsenosidimutans]QEA16444.1 hypothetical protein FRF71_10045 [Novosphingobium ginsenosidimutans]
MIAQEERIFDIYFMRRLTEDEAKSIIGNANWPDEFLSYERVLKTGHALRFQPFIFFEPLSLSLVLTAQDLRRERPEISEEEIAFLLGVSPSLAKRLLAAKSSGQASWWKRALRHLSL